MPSTPLPFASAASRYSAPVMWTRLSMPCCRYFSVRIAALPLILNFQRPLEPVAVSPLVFCRAQRNLQVACRLLAFTFCEPESQASQRCHAFCCDALRQRTQQLYKAGYGDINQVIFYFFTPSAPFHIYATPAFNKSCKCTMPTGLFCPSTTIT